MIDADNQPNNTQDSTVLPEDGVLEAPDAAKEPEELVDLEHFEIPPDEVETSTPGGTGVAASDAASVGADQAVVSSAVQAEYQAALAQMEREIQGLKAQLEERSGQYMRIAADFENYRKRTQREKEDLDLQARCSTIHELLPVIDNFERARSHIKPQTDEETTIHKSYQSVYKQLVECLKRLGVTPMRSEGSEFDPNLHEAVMRQETNDHPEGTVLEELQRGYMLGDRVLRHAMVKVAAAGETSPSSEGVASIEENSPDYPEE